MKNIFKVLPIVLLVLISGCEEVDNFAISNQEGIVLVDPGIGTLVISNENINNHLLHTQFCKEIMRK